MSCRASVGGGERDESEMVTWIMKRHVEVERETSNHVFNGDGHVVVLEDWSNPHSRFDGIHLRI